MPDGLISSGLQTARKRASLKQGALTELGFDWVLVSFVRCDVDALVLYSLYRRSKQYDPAAGARLNQPPPLSVRFRNGVAVVGRFVMITLLPVDIDPP